MERKKVYFPEISAGVRFTVTCTVHVLPPWMIHPLTTPTWSNWSCAPTTLSGRPPFTQLIDPYAPTHGPPDPGRDQRRLGGHKNFFSFPPFWKTWYLYVWTSRLGSLCSGPLVPWSLPGPPLLPVSGSPPPPRGGPPPGQTPRTLRRWGRVGPRFRLQASIEFGPNWLIYKTLLILFEEQEWVRRGLPTGWVLVQKGFTGVGILWYRGVQIERDTLSQASTRILWTTCTLLLFLGWGTTLNQAA